MDELKALLAAKYDPMQILDILQMDSEDLVEALEERILEHLYLFDDLDVGDLDE